MVSKFLFRTRLLKQNPGYGSVPWVVHQVRFKLHPTCTIFLAFSVVSVRSYVPWNFLYIPLLQKDKNGVRYREVIWYHLLELEIVILFASAWWNKSIHSGRAVVLPQETLPWLSTRLKHVTLAKDGDCQLSHQFSVTKIGCILKLTASAPKGLQNSMVFPATSLSSINFIWFNSTYESLNFDLIGGKKVSVKHTRMSHFRAL